LSKKIINGFRQLGSPSSLQSNLSLFTDQKKEKRIQFVWNQNIYDVNISKNYQTTSRQIIRANIADRYYPIWLDIEYGEFTANRLVTSPTCRWSVLTWTIAMKENRVIYKYSKSKVILIDNDNFKNINEIFHDSAIYVEDNYTFWKNPVFTKNDSVFLLQKIFMNKGESYISFKSLIEVQISKSNLNIRSFKINIDQSLYAFPDNVYKSKTSLKDFILAPNGNIYVLVSKWGNDGYGFNPNDRKFYIAKLKKFDSYYGIENPIKIFEGVGKYYDEFNFDKVFFPQTPGTYHKIDFTTKSLCNDLTYKFTNNSDTSWFDHYKWYWGDGDSSYSDNKTQNVLHQFKKAGTYEVLLRAYNPEGGSVWYTDSVIILPEPIAKFGTKNTIGCQWIAVSFADSSLLQNKVHTWRWNFGDGIDTIIGSTNNIMPKNKSIKHTYTTSGKFNVQLQVSDGRCTDTFNAIQNISILPAPRPGIAIDKTTGCTPLEVQFGRIYSDLTDSTIYHFKPALVPINRFSSATNKTIMLQSGPFTLIQYLYGPSGCITQDSVKLNITPGIPVGYRPELKRSTVINNRTTLTEWKPVPHAKYYQVYRNGLIHDVVNDTIFMDYLPSEIDQSYTYEIRAKDSCDNLGGIKSNIGKTIYLNVKEIEPVMKSNFATALLTWTPYEDWSLTGGVKGYECLGTYDMETSNWQPLTNLNDTHFNDKNFIQPKKFEKCFVVKARSVNQAYESQSNSYCLPYQATLFAPSAFTPNGDGLNDEFNIFNYGFDKFTLTIFNSWGQKLFEQNNSEGTWKPEKDVPQGVYVYYVKAYRKGVEYTFTNTVTLLK
jgi:gliding motility-associated-like protein